MDSAIFDDVTNTFLRALASGTVSLGVYSIPLLGAFALIGWYWQFGRSLAFGGHGLADALAGALLYVVNIGIAYWILVNLSPMTTAAYETFLQWGLQVGGGTGSVTPSGVVDLGFQIAKPLMDYANNQKGWAALFNISQMLMYNVAALAILCAFPFVAIALMLVQIEYHLAVMVGAVLIPFGVFAPTAFLTEFSIGWITGNLIRVLLTTAIVGLGFPLFSTALVRLTAGGDPTLYSALIVAMVSVLYGALALVLPAKASAACGRVVVGLTNQAVLGGAMTLARIPLGVTGAIRGASSLLAKAR